MFVEIKGGSFWAEFVELLVKNEDGRLESNVVTFEGAIAEFYISELPEVLREFYRVYGSESNKNTELTIISATS